MCSLDVLLLVVDVLFAGVYGFSSIFHHFFFHLFFIKILVDVVCGAALRMLLHSYITHTHTLHALSKRSATAHSGTQIQFRSILCVCNACYGNDNCLPAHKHISTHIQQRAHNNAWVLCDNHNWSVSQPRIMNISFIIIDISSYSACTLSYCLADALIAIEQRHQWNRACDACSDIQRLLHKSKRMTRQRRTRSVVAFARWIERSWKSSMTTKLINVIEIDPIRAQSID